MADTSILSPGFGYRMLRIANDQFGMMPLQLSEEQRHRAESIATRELLMEQAVLTSPEARGVAVPPSQVKRALADIRSRYEDEGAFREALADNGLNELELETALTRDLLVEAVLAVVSSAVPEVEDTEVRLYYYMHTEKFQQPEIRTARHILITVNPDFPENTRQAARERLSAIAKRLHKQPRRFEEQALKHSECPSSLQGGLLGQLKQGTLYPELDQVLFDMREGQVSDIVESPLGLHLLWCEHIQPARALPLTEVSNLLRDKLTEQQRHRHQRQWLRTLMAEWTAENSSNVEETLT